MPTIVDKERISTSSNSPQGNKWVNAEFPIYLVEVLRRF